MTRRRWIVSAAILAALVAWAGARMDWNCAAIILRRSSVAPLVAAVLINMASLALRGVRWWLFLRAIGARSMWLAIRGAIVGAGCNNLLIANGGDAARALLVARAGAVSASAVIATLTVDRLFDPLCFTLLLFIGTFAVPLPPWLAGARLVTGIMLLGVCVLLGALVHTPKTLVEPKDSRGWRAHLRGFRNCVASLSTAPRFAAAVILSMATWSCEIATFALAACAVHLALPLAGDVSTMLMTNAGLVLRATPGNVGFFQVAYVIAARPFGVAAEAAIAASLLLQLVQIVPVTLLAVALAPRILKRAG